MQHTTNRRPKKVRSKAPSSVILFSARFLHDLATCGSVGSLLVNARLSLNFLRRMGLESTAGCLSQSKTPVCMSFAGFLVLYCYNFRSRPSCKFSSKSARTSSFTCPARRGVPRPTPVHVRSATRGYPNSARAFYISLGRKPRPQKT